MSYSAVCFGEVLWDNLPTGKKLGGAPLNVSYHLNRLGVPTAILTRIGDDQNGREIEKSCAELGIPSVLFQKDAEHPTSTVEVEIGEDKEVHYEIVFPVAWDFIEATAVAQELVSKADFFVFGSLSARNEPTYRTLLNMLDRAKFKVFDVNLRTPFYTKERVFELLERADLVKVNEKEIAILSEWNESSYQKDIDRAGELMDRFAIQEMLVTYGAKGAVYHSRETGVVYHFPAYKVDVNDTIGSGDSFLAAFLSKRFEKDEQPRVEDMLDFSAMVSGFVTQNSGACPPYQQHDIIRFQWLNPLYETKY